ncbi:unnamed protein product [Bubo scandiacus]
MMQQIGDKSFERETQTDNLITFWSLPSPVHPASGPVPGAAAVASEPPSIPFPAARAPAAATSPGLRQRCRSGGEAFAGTPRASRSEERRGL